MESNNTIKELASIFSQEHNLNDTSVEMALLGTLARVKSAVDKGEPLNATLVEAAFVHWFKAQEKYYQDLIDNKGGAMDDMCNKVYESIKAKTTTHNRDC